MQVSLAGPDPFRYCTSAPRKGLGVRAANNHVLFEIPQYLHIYIYIYIYIYTVHALKKLTFYGRTTPTATGVLRLRLRAYDAYSYGRTWSKAMSVLGLRLRAYLV